MVADKIREIGYPALLIVATVLCGQLFCLRAEYEAMSGLIAHLERYSDGRAEPGVANEIARARLGAQFHLDNLKRTHRVAAWFTALLGLMFLVAGKRKLGSRIAVFAIVMVGLSIPELSGSLL